MRPPQQVLQRQEASLRKTKERRVTSASGSFQNPKVVENGQKWPKSESAKSSFSAKATHTMACNSQRSPRWQRHLQKAIQDFFWRFPKIFTKIPKELLKDSKCIQIILKRISMDVVHDIPPSLGILLVHLSLRPWSPLQRRCPSDLTPARFPHPETQYLLVPPSFIKELFHKSFISFLGPLPTSNWTVSSSSLLLRQKVSGSTGLMHRPSLPQPTSWRISRSWTRVPLTRTPWKCMNINELLLNQSKRMTFLS